MPSNPVGALVRRRFLGLVDVRVGWIGNFAEGQGKLAVEVVILTGKGTIHAAVRAMKHGAYDFLTKPCEMEFAESVCRKAGERKRLLVENRLWRRAWDSISHNILGESKAIRELKDTIHRAASTDMPVLICGETGTGKELVAKAIHHQSARRNFPLVTINAAGFTPSLLESELFGHEKGAFTSAEKTRPGLFEEAENGPSSSMKSSICPRKFKRTYSALFNSARFADSDRISRKRSMSASWRPAIVI